MRKNGCPRPASSPKSESGEVRHFFLVQIVAPEERRRLVGRLTADGWLVTRSAAMVRASIEVGWDSPARKERMMRKNQHVVPHAGRWAVRGEGNGRATSVHDTQREAIRCAREIAQRERAELVIHGRDGAIRDKDSFGPDPNPPRDQRR